MDSQRDIQDATRVEELQTPAEEAKVLSKEIQDGKKKGEVIRFVGQNGQDYITKYDADVYGGGYVGVRRYYKSGTPVEKPKEFEKQPSVKPGSGSLNYEVLPLSELKEIAQAMKIRGWANSKKETLLEKIMPAKNK